MPMICEYGDPKCSEEEPCQKCCDHSDIDEDERCCLICGADVTEDLIAKAEWYAEMSKD